MQSPRGGRNAFHEHADISTDLGVVVKVAVAQSATVNGLGFDDIEHLDLTLSGEKAFLPILQLPACTTKTSILEDLRGKI